MKLTLPRLFCVAGFLMAATVFSSQPPYEQSLIHPKNYPARTQVVQQSLSLWAAQSECLENMRKDHLTITPNMRKNCYESARKSLQSPPPSSNQTK